METQLQEAPSRETISEIAESIAGEIATKLYHKLKLLSYMPEIKAFEAGKIKALRGKDALKYLAKLAK